MILVFLYTAMQANTYIYVFLSIVTIRPKKHIFICLLLFIGEKYDVWIKQWTFCTGLFVYIFCKQSLLLGSRI